VIDEEIKSHKSKINELLDIDEKKSKVSHAQTKRKSEI
jgi:hypothetical protein